MTSPASGESPQRHAIAALCDRERAAVAAIFADHGDQIDDVIARRLAGILDGLDLLEMELREK